MAARATRPVIVARAIRAFADGFAAVLLARYLQHIGFDGFQIGVIVTSTLLGSAALTLWAGLRLNRWGAQRVLFASCALMALTGLGFSTVTRFWPLVIVGFVGTLNPSGGDVSLFLPTEQAVLADLSEGHARTQSFAVYNLAAAFAAALGALASPLPEKLADAHGWDVARVERLSFLVYVVVAVAAALVYRSLRTHAGISAPRGGLHKSRSIVIRLSVLFSLDAAGGGFAVTSLLVLYLSVRFGLSTAATGATLAAAGTLTAFSQLVSARIAAPHRPGTHDGVHAPAREHLPHPRGHRAERARRGHVPVVARRAVTDGRAGAAGAGDARASNPTSGRLPQASRTCRAASRARPLPRWPA